MTNEHCFACGKPITGKPHVAWTNDGQIPWVGSDCYRKIIRAGEKGWQPTAKHGRQGPRLYPPGNYAPSRESMDRVLARIIQGG